MTQLKRKVAACYMAHPDDCEILAAGTLALLAERGWEIHIITSTPGDCGSMELGPDEIAAVRRKEGAHAAERIGATYHCLEFRDLTVTYNGESAKKAATLFREIAPTLVFTHALHCYMLDHEETAKIARTATFAYGIPNYVDGPIKDGSMVPYFYYADPLEAKGYYGDIMPAGIYVDISTTFDTKIEMLKRHASQRQWLMKHHGMDEYINSMKHFSHSRGREVKVDYAEGFRQHKGHPYPHDCLLHRELQGLVKTTIA